MVCKYLYLLWGIQPGVENMQKGGGEGRRQKGDWERQSAA